MHKFICILNDKAKIDYKKMPLTMGNLDLCIFLQCCYFSAFFLFMTLSYYFEPFMVPMGLLLLFLKHYIVTSFIGKTYNAGCYISLNDRIVKVIIYCLKNSLFI